MTKQLTSLASLLLLVGGMGTTRAASPPAQITGDLIEEAKRLEGFAKTTFGSGANTYVAPSAGELNQFRLAAAALWAGDHTGAISNVVNLDYEGFVFTDTNFNQTFIGLRSRETNGTPLIGWGTYLVNTNAAINALLEAVHPHADFRTPLMTAETFMMAGAKGFLQAGAHRDVNGSGTGDIPDLTNSVFHVVHEQWSGPGGENTAWQIHGYNPDNHSFPAGNEAILSTGEDGTNLMSGNIVNLDAQLEAIGVKTYAFSKNMPTNHPVNILVNEGVDGFTFQSLGARLNEQGRYSRGLGGTFMHLEFVKFLRTNTTARTQVSAAIAQAIQTPAGPPSITQQPSDRTLVSGSDVSLSVSATGLPALSYQWFHNATNALLGANSPTLTLTNVTTAQAGGYVVVVTNLLGSALSDIAWLQVNVPTNLTVSPSTNVFFGDAFALEAEVTPANAELSFLWNLNGFVIPGATNARYAVSRATAWDGGSYLVRATNDAVEFSGNPEVTMQSRLRAGIRRTDTAVLANYHDEWQAGSFPPGWRYLWNANGEITDRPETFRELEADPTGIWDIDAGTPGRPNPGSEAIHLHLTRTGGHPGTGTSPHRYAIVEYTIPAPATARPLAVANTSVAVDANSGDGVTLVVFNNLGEIFRFQNLPPGHAGSFDTFVGTLGAGDRIYVAFGPNGFHNNDNVSFDFSVVDLSAGVSQVDEGVNLSFQSFEGGFGYGGRFNYGPFPLFYQWSKDGQPLPGATNPTLHLTDVRTNDNGQYRVSITDGTNNVVSPAQELSVRAILTPVITQQPANAAVNLGETATFQVTAAGIEPLAYQWHRDGTPLAGATNSSLTLANTTTAMTGVYTVSISNAHGSVLTQPARLWVFPLGESIAMWGSNDDGRSTPPPGLPPLRQISLGAHHTVALDHTGSVWAWGRSTAGQLSIPAMGPAVMVAAGGWHSVALLADGRPVVWGQILSGMSIPAMETNIQSVAANQQYTVLLRQDGTVAVYGGSNRALDQVPNFGQPVVQMAAAVDHIVVLLADGTVRAWGGANSYGETNVPAGLTNVVKVTAGIDHSLALKADGTIVGWGNPDSGRTASPATSAPIRDVVSGYRHNLALNENGELLVWGNNGAGQINVPAKYSGIVSMDGGFSNSGIVFSGPYITNNPISQSLDLGAGTTLSVGASGANLTYQWHQDGDALPAATNATLIVSNFGIADAGSYTVGVSNSSDGLLSDPAILSLNRMPQIITFPIPTTVPGIGETLTLNATANSGLPVTYSSDNPAVATVNGNIVTASGAGTANIRAHQAGNELWAPAPDAVLILTIYNPPVIIQEPIDQTAFTGSNVVFSVAAGGSPPLSYQWLKDGVNIANATNASLSLSNLTIGDAGQYSVLVSNPGSSITSSHATLVVHSIGNGTAYRHLTNSYVPTVRFQVSITATPEAGTSVYAIEDVPPSGWLVHSVSHGGVFDTGTGKIKFGPYFDATPRTLTYELQPPQDANTIITFNGSASFNGVSLPIQGDTVLEPVLHPADINPRDGRLNLNETTAYGAAWKQGLTWPREPTNSIPIAFVTRAAALWRGGEVYQVNPSIPIESFDEVTQMAAEIEPIWWINPPTRGPAGLADPATNRAVVTLSAGHSPGRPLQVSITATPIPTALSYAMEVRIPAEWNVDTGSIAPVGSGNFVATANLRQINFGPFFDNTPRTFTFDLHPPTNAIGAIDLTGILSVDGFNTPLTGQLRSTRGPLFRAGANTGHNIAAEGFRLRVQAAQGRELILEYKDILTSPNWIPIFTNTVGQSDLDLHDTGAIGRTFRFYRVLER